MYIYIYIYMYIHIAKRGGLEKVGLRLFNPSSQPFSKTPFRPTSLSVCPVGSEKSICLVLARTKRERGFD